MRWGIQTESSDTHGEVNTCLTEIDLCQKYSLATNFVVSRCSIEIKRIKPESLGPPEPSVWIATNAGENSRNTLRTFTSVDFVESCSERRCGNPLGLVSVGYQFDSVCLHLTADLVDDTRHQIISRTTIRHDHVNISLLSRL